MRSPPAWGLIARSSVVVLLAAIAGPFAACRGEEDATRASQTSVPEAPALPASVPAPEVEGGIVIVPPAQVHEWQLEGTDLVLVDARDAVQYAQEHIPGAINISYVDIRAGADLPSRDARIVVYCSDSDCPISQYAYESLQRIGFRELYDMREGLQGWKAAGYPTAVGGATGDAAADTAQATEVPADTL